MQRELPKMTEKLREEERGGSRDKKNLMEEMHKIIQSVRKIGNMKKRNHDNSRKEERNADFNGNFDERNPKHILS